MTQVLARRPRRIQRRRLAGWQRPVDVQGREPIYCGRPSRWGNPFYPGMSFKLEEGGTRILVRHEGEPVAEEVMVRDRAHAVELHRAWMIACLQADPSLLEPLRGRDLMCWCGPGGECHVDTLIALANPLRPLLLIYRRPTPVLSPALLPKPSRRHVGVM